MLCNVTIVDYYGKSRRSDEATKRLLLLYKAVDLLLLKSPKRRSAFYVSHVAEGTKGLLL